jgi:uncharacterized protein YyaL (SSP411 family)
MLKADGSLWRTYTGGQTSIPAFLEDYVYLGDAFTQLYQLSFDIHWLSLAKQLADYAMKNFTAAAGQALFAATSTASDFNTPQLPLTDNAMPSANAVMAKLLYNLDVYYQDDRYLSASRAMLSTITGQLKKKEALYFASWVYVAGLFAYGTNEVVIAGPDAVDKNMQLHKNYFPQAIFMGTAGEENLALIRGKLVTGKTLIYVCTNKTCRRPLENTEEAVKLLVVQ